MLEIKSKVFFIGIQIHTSSSVMFYHPKKGFLRKGKREVAMQKRKIYAVLL